MAAPHDRRRFEGDHLPFGYVLFYDRLYVRHRIKYARIYSQYFRDVVSFSAIFVWCGFQTGNFAQVCNLTRCFFLNIDRQ